MVPDQNTSNCYCPVMEIGLNWSKDSGEGLKGHHGPLVGSLPMVLN